MGTPAWRWGRRFGEPGDNACGGYQYDNDQGVRRGGEHGVEERGVLAQVGHVPTGCHRSQICTTCYRPRGRGIDVAGHARHRTQSPKAAQRLRVRTSKLSRQLRWVRVCQTKRLMNGVSPGVGRQLARFMKPAAFIQPRHSLGSHGEELGRCRTRPPGGCEPASRREPLRETRIVGILRDTYWYPQTLRCSRIIDFGAGLD